MNALSDLAAEVKFRERMRGYDYKEVDNYVKTVSRVAAQARDRIAELEHRLDQFESQDGNDEGVTEIRETLLRTLVLAQRTADSAVSEARSEAQSITDSAKERAAKTVSEAETAANERLRSAEERAARMLSESEENGQIIIAEAKRTAASELASEREHAQEELRDLETTRGDLESIVAEIQARLDNERDMLRSLAVSFQSFVEKFEPVDGADGDAAESLEAAEDRADRPEAADDDQAVEAGTEPGDAADPEPPGGPALEFLPAEEENAQEPGDALEDVPASDAVDTDSVPEVPVVEWDEADEDEEVGHDLPDDLEASERDHTQPDVVRLQSSSGGNGASHTERDDAHNGDEAAAAGPATMPFGVDSPELFDMDAEEDDEFIEQLRQVVSSDATLPDKDAAMAAFFDHDEGAGA
ncbi:MAG: DivIVA domain-containing protein [Acidimicrobiaceae bacterium]|nr:DivIVA domain-containing protein [Acidimicrobiaceae bacterium]